MFFRDIADADPDSDEVTEFLEKHSPWGATDVMRSSMRGDQHSADTIWRKFVSHYGIAEASYDVRVYVVKVILYLCINSATADEYNKMRKRGELFPNVYFDSTTIGRALVFAICYYKHWEENIKIHYPPDFPRRKKGSVLPKYFP